MSYLRQTYLLPADLEDAAAALLSTQGCLGIQTFEAGEGMARLDAYFPAGTTPRPRVPFPAAQLFEESELPEADWLAPWREGARPIEVGERFLLDPREPDGEPDVSREELANGRIHLRLPARRAFGTGSHESTRLVLEHLETLSAEGLLAGRRVLDVGSGTGVLAFAALKLGATAAVGTEIDLAAALVAGENRRLNRLQPTFLTAPLSALQPCAAFDLALINIIPERILPEVHLLPPLLRSGAEAIFSGILSERGEWVRGQLREHGFITVAERTAAEWVAYRCRFRSEAR